MPRTGTHAAAPVRGTRLIPALRCLLVALGVLAAAPAVAQDEGVVRAEIRSGAGRQLKGFYEARGYMPVWVRGGDVAPEAGTLVALLASADLDGLDPDDYHVDALRRALGRAQDGDAEAVADAELKLSRAFADYVRDLREERGPGMVYVDEELEPERRSRLEVLREAAVAPSLATYLATMGWMNPAYRQLREALARYRDDWGDLPRVTVPEGPRLRAGDKGARVALLRARLGLGDGNRFDKALAARVRAFQAVHGLDADGIAGAATVAALNRGPAAYEKLIRLNMERARALPGPATRHVVVDAAAQRLWMYEGGKAAGSMKVVVGKPSDPTPMMAAQIRYVVLNPYWNMPPDLVRRRLAPKMLEGGSLEASGYEAFAGWDRDARPLDPSEIDWQAVADGREELRVRQVPGKANAMGHMKFMFPNDMGIYLHDTPDRELFGQAARNFSAGCVRVEDARRLAAWLFDGDPPKPGDKPDQQVWLPRPVPVYITYLTVSAGDGKNPRLAFLPDIYGRDGAEGKEPALAGEVRFPGTRNVTNSLRGKRADHN
jgi:murein L,D-transpeptidase YcbB/YkuD